MSDRSGAAKRTTKGARGRDQESGSLAPRAPLSEWVVAGVSALLVLAMLAYTVTEGLRRPKGSAVVTVTADSVVKNDAGHVVMFTLTNDGDDTAASVHVHGALWSDGRQLEESEVVLDYVPLGAQRTGSLQFRGDPAGHELIVRVTGFSAP
jgi:uncharacterized protein (TIGR02588 family)